MTTDSEEEWRPVVGFDGYDVSNHGRVRSLRGTSTRLIAGSSVQGYRVVDMQAGKKWHRVRVHRAVLMAFRGLPPEGRELGCHGDGDRSNNRLDNLRWDSPRGNASDKVAHGTQLRGEVMHQAVLTEGQVLAIHAAISAGASRWSLAKEYGVSYGAIHGISTGLNWSWLTGRAAA